MFESQLFANGSNVGRNDWSAPFFCIALLQGACSLEDLAPKHGMGGRVHLKDRGTIAGPRVLLQNAAFYIFLPWHP